MRSISVSVLVVSILLTAATLSAQELWVGKDGNIRNVDTRAMIVDDGGLYLATRSEVYRASDIKEKWETVFTLPSGENEIQCLAGRSRNVMVGTKRGLFRSADYGKTWKNVFRTIIPEKNNILAIQISRRNPKKVLLATEKGVFLSEDFGCRWQDISANLKNKRVSCIALNKELMYAGGEDGLYARCPSGWDRIYVKSAVEKTSGEEGVSDSADIEEEESGRGVNCVALKDHRLYIGADNKIMSSSDAGESWEPFPSEGLVGSLRCIAAASKSDRLYAATTKGVFEFIKAKGRWLELYRGMDKVFDTRELVFAGSDESSLWALTDKGLYKLESGHYVQDQYIDVERNLKGLKIIFDNEPAFKELQKAAMRFGEVSPEKIARMRTEARLKGLLPKVSFGNDFDRSTNTEIYTSATKDYAVVGPEDTSSGWDFSVSWELGDLIWSTDQTSIDVRSRLNTQLRNDILDDLRRAYFERKRLQFELIQNPPKDVKGRFEKELRIQELTQAIDDLTGNYLSEHIRKSETD